jgi:predicted RNase H-like nuclease (RuvC/YqgF family)
MPRLSISLSEERSEKIEKMVDDSVVNSKSKAVNKLITRGERLGECERRIERLTEEYEAEIEELEDEIESLENRLEESRRREIARDKTQQEIDTLREELHETRDERDAPFFVRWYRWYRRRG